MLDRANSQLDQSALRERLGSAYASGALDSAMELLVETQAALCPASTNDIGVAETVAGAFFEGENPAPLSSDAFSRSVARLASEGAQQAAPLAPTVRAAATRASALLNEIFALPHTVHDCALEALGRGGWTFGGPGIRTLELDLGDHARAELIRIEPGWGAPRHNHTGGEFTLVLTGGFADERGRYNPGDIAYGGPGISHRPIATGDVVCYCLAVSEGRPVFSGALGLLQKIWRN